LGSVPSSPAVHPRLLPITQRRGLRRRGSRRFKGLYKQPAGSGRRSMQITSLSASTTLKSQFSSSQYRPAQARGSLGNSRKPQKPGKHGRDTVTQRQVTSKYAGAPATAASLEMRQQMPRQRKEPRCQRTARRDRRSPRQNGQPKKRPSRPSARSGPQVPRNAIKIYASESRKDQLNCSCRDTRLESYMLLVQATGTSRHTTDASGIRMQT
jgi:hypothetical protein